MSNSTLRVYVPNIAGDRDAAKAAFKQTEGKTAGVGQKMDLAFSMLRCGPWQRPHYFPAQRRRGRGAAWQCTSVQTDPGSVVRAISNLLF